MCNTHADIIMIMTLNYIITTKCVIKPSCENMILAFGNIYERRT